MVLIRDTIDPTRERDVPAAEALDLERQGLLLVGTRARTDDGLRAAAVRQIQQRQPDPEPVPHPAAPEPAPDAELEADTGPAPESPVGDDPDSPAPDTDTDTTLES